MKKTIISALLLMAVMFSFAKAGAIEERAKAKTDPLVKELSLNKEQTAKVTAFFVEYITAKEQLKSLTQTSKEEIALKTSKIEEKMSANLGTVLTAQQQKKLKAFYSSKK